MTTPAANTPVDKVQQFIDLVKATLPQNVAYMPAAGVEMLERELKQKIKPEHIEALNDRNIYGAADIFRKHVIDVSKAAHAEKKQFNISDIAKQAADGLTARSNHKNMAINGVVDETAKTAFTTALGTKSDLVKNMEKSYEMNSGGMGMAVRYGTAAVGTFLIYNRIKAMFNKKEVVNEQGEVEQKNPSFWSRLGNLLLATGVGIVTYKVGVQNKTFGQVGEDISNKWQKYVTNRSQSAGISQLLP